MNAKVALCLAGLTLAAAGAVWAEEGARITKVSPTTFAVGGKLAIDVVNLKALCPQRAPSQKPSLYLDGYRVSRIVPVEAEPESKSEAGLVSHLQFDLAPGWALEKGTDETNVWALLATGSLFNHQQRLVKATLGYEACPGGTQAQTPPWDGGELKLDAFPTGWRLAWIASMLLIVGLTVWLGKRTTLLREGGAGGPYSLARTQIAFWTMLVLGAFLLILMSTGFVNSMRGDLLVLLGISAATGLSGAVVDAGKTAQLARSTALQSQKTDLANAIATYANPPADLLDQQRQIVVEMAQIPPMTKQTYKGFFTDLLHDGNGYSIHRLQLLLWTVVLGGYFMYAVASRLLMPSFSTELLTLMGISSGTYVALKTQEKVV